MQLGLGHLRDKGTDQHRSLGHSDEGSSAGGNTLDTGDVDDVDDGLSHAGDDGLDNVVVVEALDDGCEEDDGGEDGDGKGAGKGDGLAIEGGGVGAKDELATLGGVAEEGLCLLGDELEDLVADGPADDQESKDVLHEDAGPDDLPRDGRAFLMVVCMDDGGGDVGELRAVCPTSFSSLQCLFLLFRFVSP